MNRQNGAPAKSTRAAIDQLLHARTQVAEQLARQLDTWQQAKQTAAAARPTLTGKRCTPGWTASELRGAGLNRPPRRATWQDRDTAATATQ
jgi:hypothetical protein